MMTQETGLLTIVFPIFHKLVQQYVSGVVQTLSMLLFSFI